MAIEPPAWIQAAQSKWTNRGAARPSFALEPGIGEESVWDYPRPPVVVPDSREVVIRTEEREVVRSRQAVRLLETASPPTFYVPGDAVVPGALVACAGESMCEWKGSASYLALAERPDHPVAWTYMNPFFPFDALLGYIAFYPGRVTCAVDGISVLPQAGGFYGGWVTPEIIGPFKGEPGTSGW